MTKRYFDLRLSCGFESGNNNITGLQVEVSSKNKWHPFNPDVETPGFLLFVYALFSCQLRYMRINSAERNIILASTSGELKLVAGENWDVKNVSVSFKSKLKTGQPTKDDMRYIKERMTHCPVSTNLPEHVTIINDVIFE